MRILLRFYSHKEIFLPSILRNSFISFIKKTFELGNRNLFIALFNEKKVKPYVFSPYLGEEFKKGQIGKTISLIFSSGDTFILTNFWNGLLTLKELKEDYLSIKGEKFRFEKVFLLPMKTIKSEKVIFKTIGITVLTDPSKSAKDFKEWYIIPSLENLDRFNEVLRKRVEERFKYIKKTERGINSLEFSLIPGEEVVETIVPHYGGYIRGFRGKFILEGDPEILQFIYDYGIGVRTGQGFGLLEVVKEL